MRKRTMQAVQQSVPALDGGAEGNRTPDLCSAIAKLSIFPAIIGYIHQPKSIEVIRVTGVDSNESYSCL